MTFSLDGSLAYVSNQVSGTVSVIATASGAVVATIGGFSCPFHSKIGFIDSRGAFTSLEDPAAAPMQTSPVGITALGFISGSYGDATGNSHGFVRDPNAQFRNFDFPEADFTVAAKINDLGQVAGQYITNFPGHAFILSGVMDRDEPLSPARFFSFDYPDSQDSALREINNSGQVTGFAHLRGNRVRHGFIATPTDSEQDDQNNQ